MWFRRDLRLADNAALFHALKNARRVYCVFIFDRALLDPLVAAGYRQDRRVTFIYESVAELKRALQAQGSDLLVKHGSAVEAIAALATELGASAVFTNSDYEPDARSHDSALAHALSHHGQSLETFKDQVIFEKDELLTSAGTPYSVYTPYRNAWIKKLTPFYVRPYDTSKYLNALAPIPQPLAAKYPLPKLSTLGFEPANLSAIDITPGTQGGATSLKEFQSRIDKYAQTRDHLSTCGTSRLSVHLRFGTVSIRALTRLAHQSHDHSWLNELIWRDFFQMILWFHPHVVHHAYKPAYDRIVWNQDAHAYAAWCAGRTGYPLVDAAMTCLNQTGTLHNRLRMVAASFLIKDLGIDWRWGERYFAHQLLDFDLASNNGNWQWVASTGCDAQPYFRIFHPVTQSKRFDPEGLFIKRYLPQLAHFEPKYLHTPWLAPHAQQHAAGCLIGPAYPHPIVDHAHARIETLRRYAAIREAVNPHISPGRPRS